MSAETGVRGPGSPELGGGSQEIITLTDTIGPPPETTTSVMVNPNATQHSIGERFVALYRWFRFINGRGRVDIDETHYDENVLLSRLVSAAAHAKAQDKVLDEIILISGDGTAGKVAGLLAGIREGTIDHVPAPEIERPEDTRPRRLGRLLIGRSEQTRQPNNIELTPKGERMATDVYGEALEALGKVKLRLIGAGNGCDIARAHNPSGNLIADDWPYESQVYPMKLTISLPNGTIIERVAVNYIGLGATANVTSAIERWRPITKRLPRFMRPFVLAAEYLTSAVQLRKTKLQIDGKAVADMSFINTSTMAKRIQTEQSHATPDFDVVRTPLHRTLWQVARTAERLRKKGVGKGETVQVSTHVLDSAAQLHFDGESLGLLPAGTKFSVETMQSASIIVKSMVPPKHTADSSNT